MSSPRTRTQYACFDRKLCKLCNDYVSVNRGNANSHAKVKKHHFERKKDLDVSMAFRTCEEPCDMEW